MMGVNRIDRRLKAYGELVNAEDYKDWMYPVEEAKKVNANDNDFALAA